MNLRCPKCDSDYVRERKEYNFCVDCGNRWESNVSIVTELGQAVEAINIDIYECIEADDITLVVFGSNGFVHWVEFGGIQIWDSDNFYPAYEDDDETEIPIETYLI